MLAGGWGKHMTDKPIKVGRITYRGSLPATDPRYQSGGWNFLLGKNLKELPKPSPMQEEADTSKPTAEKLASAALEPCPKTS